MSGKYFTANQRSLVLAFIGIIAIFVIIARFHGENFQFLEPFTEILPNRRLQNFRGYGANGDPSAGGMMRQQPRGMESGFGGRLRAGGGGYNTEGGGDGSAEGGIGARSSRRSRIRQSDLISRIEQEAGQ